MNMNSWGFAPCEAHWTYPWCSTAPPPAPGDHIVLRDRQGSAAVSPRLFGVVGLLIGYGLCVVALYVYSNESFPAKSFARDLPLQPRAWWVCVALTTAFASNLMCITVQFSSYISFVETYTANATSNTLLGFAWCLCGVWVVVAAKAQGRLAAAPVVLAAGCAVCAMMFETNWRGMKWVRILCVDVPYALFASVVTVAAAVSVARCAPVLHAWGFTLAVCSIVIVRPDPVFGLLPLLAVSTWRFQETPSAWRYWNDVYAMVILLAVAIATAITIAALSLV